jgi:hypothetical protein
MGKVKSSDSMLVISKMCSLLMVKFSFCQACGKSTVAQQHSQVTQHLSGSKHIAAIARLNKKIRQVSSL